MIFLHDHKVMKNFKSNTVEKLKEIFGSDKIACDLEDLYVYSFERFLLTEKCYPSLKAIVKLTSTEELYELEKLADQLNLLMVYRGKKTEYPMIKNSEEHDIIIVDNIPPIDIDTALARRIEKKHEKFDVSRREFKKNMRQNLLGTYKRIAYAMNLYLKDKPFYYCTECNTCTGYCTVAPFFNHIETWTSKGRYLLIEGLMKGELNPSKKIIDVIYSCTLCGLCFMQCTKELNMDRAVIAARRYIAERGLAPKPVKVVLKNIQNKDNPFGLPRDIRVSFMDDISRDQLRHVFTHARASKILFWVGCNTAFRAPEIAQATISIIAKSDLNVGLLGEKEGCCGSILIFSGLFDHAKENAERIIKEISNTGASTVITSCAGCYEAFTVLYQEMLGIEVPFKVQHISQLMDQLKEGGVLSFRDLDMKVTYHDPCSLGRHSNVYNTPRNILRAIPNLELIEMPLTKENSRCCGGGGGFYAINNEASIDSAMRILKDVLSLGLKTIVTTCPQCYTTFRIAARQLNKMEIFDITQIIDKSLQ